MANITGIRAKPLDPCKIEAQYDGGAWVTVADMSCCGGGGGGSCVPPLRVGADGGIQKYDPSTGGWVPVAPGQTPATDTSVPAPFPDDAGGRCKGASGMVGLVKRIETKMLTALIDGASVEVAALDLIAIAADFFGASWVVGLVANVVAGVLSLGEVVMADALAAIPDADLLCVFFRHVGPDGKITPEQVTALANDLIAEGQKIITDQGLTAYPLAWPYIDAAVWVTFLGSRGLDNAASLGQPDDADNCELCPWEVYLDFRKAKYGFDLTSPSPDNIYPGHFISGEGWKTGPNVTIGDEVRATIHTQAITISDAQLRYVAHHTNNGDNYDGQNGIHSAFFSPFIGAEAGVVDGQVVTAPSTDGSATLPVMTLYAACQKDAHHIEGDTVIREVWIRATGPIPQAWADAVVTTGGLPDA